MITYKIEDNVLVQIDEETSDFVTGSTAYLRTIYRDAERDILITKIGIYFVVGRNLGKSQISPPTQEEVKWIPEILKQYAPEN